MCVIFFFQFHLNPVKFHPACHSYSAQQMWDASNEQQWLKNRSYLAESVDVSSQKFSHIFLNQSFFKKAQPSKNARVVLNRVKRKSNKPIVLVNTLNEFEDSMCRYCYLSMKWKLAEAIKISRFCKITSVQICMLVFWPYGFVRSKVTDQHMWPNHENSTHAFNNVDNIRASNRDFQASEGISCNHARGTRQRSNENINLIG